MPPVAPLMPRKMLPPPTTIAISTLSSARAFVTSAAMRCTTSESMPKLSDWSANASPESLSTTRRYLLSDISSSSRGRAGVSLLADLDAREAPDRGIAAQSGNERPNGRLLVLDERLLDERSTRVGLVEAVELAVDDLGPGLLGLALLARLRLVDLALALDVTGGHLVTR